MLARVLLPLPLSNAYTYRVPSDIEEGLVVGSRVVVQLGTKKYYSGIVVGLETDEATGYELKDILEVLDREPIVLPEQLRLWQWMSDYYLTPLGEVSRIAMPTLMSKGALEGETTRERYRPRTETYIRLTERYCDREEWHGLIESLARTPKRVAVLERYAELVGLAASQNLQNPALRGEVSRVRLLKQEGVSPAVVTALTKVGILETYEKEVGRLHADATQVVEHLPLTPAQQTALGEIEESFRSRRVCLLHGVTSSGKTEIYIRLIEGAIARGEQVVYLLPEIALATQITARLRRIFGDRLGVYHSQLSQEERMEIWKKQLSAEPYRLLLGPRSALFLPLKKPGLIIVDEEHETSYKQQDNPPLYNARDVAIVLATQTDARVLLGTATPSVETYTNALSGKYGLVSLNTRYADLLLPEVIVEDVRELRRTKQMRGPFSPRLIDEMTAALRRGRQVILFQNRRGYAPVMECRECGWTPRCERCDVTLTHHRSTSTLVCHYCGRSVAVPPVCPNCGSHDLRDVGFGTEKVEESVRSLFPDARVARLDLDTTRSRTAYDRILGDFASGRTDILIGTQMVSKGLDFDSVHVVGVLNADTLLSMPNFRTFERAYQMMTQVSGRAGRKGERGRVIIQTTHTDYPVVGQVVEGDYMAMYNEEINERRLFNFPPFCRIIEVNLRHRDKGRVETAARLFADIVHSSQVEAPEGLEVYGPEPPLVGRVSLLYIRQITIKVPRTMGPARVRAILRRAAAEVRAEKGLNSVMILFDVDPL